VTLEYSATTFSARASWLAVGVGVVALAVAMGIGRFAFTPLLPLMLSERTMSAATGAEWAAANYAGYLIGALSASRFSLNPRLGLSFGLCGVALTTLAGAFVDGASMALPGAALRAAAGVFSAWVLVCASSWCLAELARRNAANLGAWVYTGVGLGIALTGMLAWLGGRQSAKSLWLELGAAALLGTFAVFALLRSQRGNGPPAARDPAPLLTEDNSGATLALVLCYGTLGFGYIVPATFLPAMAREQVSDPLWFGLTWPIFGLAAALSVGAAARLLSGWSRRRVWSLAQGTMALGTALPVATKSLWALAASSVFVGGTFMVATMAGLQLAREQYPSNPTPLLARMTVAFAVGQVAGPVVLRLLGSGRWGGWDALALANAVATALLGGTAVWLWHGTNHRRGAELVRKKP
jgi:hypothetical protein